MKGVILAGGTGSRLHPLTKVTNKHLLGVYSKPMIYYPLFALKRAGIRDILIISGKGHAGHFLELLGSGGSLGLRLSYEVQEEAGGIAQALSLAEKFSSGEQVCVILGDNIIQDDISKACSDFALQPKGAKIFIKKVIKPESYGVPTIEGNKILKITEKPKKPDSPFAVTGVYMYDYQVFDIIRSLKPSGRGELEITDVNNFYIEQGTLTYEVLEGFWGDCGESFDSLLEASELVQKSELKLMDNSLNLPERQQREIKNNENSPNKSSRKYLIANKLI
jgi:glucose-1-phosphate thymidylyltransferase